MPHVAQSNKPFISEKTLESVVKELRLLRETVELLIPQEDLRDYTNPEKIKNSYKKALKKYPPVY
ncbi:MAG: hypothetical protein HYT64_01250 [Candidatus Yanofskybacteria bacterium]|nr:hypothetical protein [Candidatus Yanofskybacteria bacterium]